MNPTIDRDLALRMLKALGLEGRAVQSVTLRFAVGRIPTARITEIVGSESVSRVVDLLEQVSLESGNCTDRKD